MPPYRKNTFNIPTVPGAGGVSNLINVLFGNGDPGGQLALQGQLLGGRLANQRSTARNLNLLGDQRALQLQDDLGLRERNPAGTIKGDIIRDKRANQTQLALGNQATNEAKALARKQMKDSGATVNVMGYELPVGIAELLGGGGVKSLIEAGPSAGNIKSQTTNRDLKGVYERNKLQSETEANYALMGERDSSTDINVEKLPGIKADTRKKEIELKVAEATEKFDIAYKKGQVKQQEKELEKLVNEVDISAQEKKKIDLEMKNYGEELSLKRKQKKADFLKTKMEFWKIRGDMQKGSTLTPKDALKLYFKIDEGIRDSLGALKMTEDQITDARKAVIQGAISDGSVEAMLKGFNEDKNFDPESALSEDSQDMLALTIQKAIDEGQENPQGQGMLSELGLEAPTATFDGGVSDVVRQLLDPGPAVTGKVSPPPPPEASILEKAHPELSEQPAAAPSPVAVGAPVIQPDSNPVGEITPDVKLSGPDLAKLKGLGFRDNHVDAISKLFVARDKAEIQKLIKLLKQGGDAQKATMLELMMLSAGI